ncbi:MULTISPECIES: Flp family type IVb pilin [unclassified Symbiopectobacterium]|uniref:Flp family type IVb pilin n=1 Tax=unclassified Symbiopectobacterium TaxID=2794573 RepID=UPI002226E462|nr:MULTISPECIES: Flp family type IVb pilin [unclassified Symbiopectobacterium]MCW2477438.1 Flp family type IVb pilin [Candidatus Symbiopectobacterium sp. NZEC151]MCW2483017.1 Flp family type IVb pilin [Candidatus Symbiopectobacterium sp. NZEC135]
MYSLVSYVQGKSIASYVYFTETVRRFGKDKRGVTAVEYAIVAAGVAAVVTVIFGDEGPVKGMLTAVFEKIKTTVESSIPGK